MSISAIVFAILYFGGLLLTLYNPVFGVLTYVFEWHNHPPYQFWGDQLPDLRWSLTPALFTLISLIINRKKLPQLASFNYRPFIWMLFYILNAFLVSATVAVNPEESYIKAELLLKLGVLYFLMTQIIRTERDYRWLIWVIILCVGNMGRLAYDMGSHRDLGFKLPGSSEANALSAHMMAILPFFMFYFMDGNRWQKLLLLVMIPFVLNAVVLANSRGTFLGLVAIAIFTLIWTRGKVRLRVVGVLIITALIFFQLTNQDFWERQKTISAEKEGGKPVTRIVLWKGAINIFRQNVFGIGGNGFPEVGVKYVDKELAAKMVEEGNKAVHNTFLQVLVEWGIIGFVFFILFLAHSFWLLVRVKRVALRVPELRYFYNEATAVQLALIGIAVAGSFHNRQYAELITWLCAFAAILFNVQQTRLAELHKADLEVTIASPPAAQKPRTEVQLT